MSTRSAVIDKQGIWYRGVYCHNYGYISGVGKVLHEFYQDADKVKELIDLGSLSSINGPDLVEDVNASHRDRGDVYDKPYRSKTIPNVAKKIGHDGYVYVYENGIWMVWVTNDTEVPEGYYPLSEVVELDIPKDKPKEEYNCVHCGEPIYPTWDHSRTGCVHDWKHKGNKEREATWFCYEDINYATATAPANAVWTEPKTKENGAE